MILELCNLRGLNTLDIVQIRECSHLRGFYIFFSAVKPQRCLHLGTRAIFFNSDN